MFRDRFIPLAVAALIFSCTSASFGADWFVDGSVSTSGTGSSWAQAFKTLDEGISAASSSSLDNVFVATGTYKSSTRLDSSDARSVVFKLKLGVKIWGGFPTGGGDRDPIANPTTLSGEFGASGPTDNAYHVVYGDTSPSALNSTARLDGFIITSGNADGASRTFSHSDRGGGMYIVQGTPAIIRCTFQNNQALGSSGAGGGGAFLSSCGSSSAPFNFVSCTFKDNFTNRAGGGLMATSSDLQLMNCLFASNSANFDGGGINNPSSLVRIINCTLTKNKANADCNSSGDGGGLWGSGAFSINYIFNSIFRENLDCTTSTTQDAQFVAVIISTSDIDHSCIQGLGSPYISVNGNINDDPDFRDPTNGDYRLDSTSPCIEAAGNGNIPFDSFDLDSDAILLEATPFDRIEGNRFAKDALASSYSACIPAIADMGPFENADCDGNGIDDAEDIAEGADDDNGDGIPDDCQDCNENDVPDPVDISEGTSQDCNGNLIPDECDAALGCAEDVNQNDIPDECECPLDVVFIVDTSPSMEGDSEFLPICQLVAYVTSELNSSARLLRVTIVNNGFEGFLCDAITYEDATGQTEGCTGDWTWEDWGAGTRAVAESFDWLPRGVRVIVPISDEGPCNGSADPELGEGCDQDDTDSINDAIDACIAHGVVVLPISGVNTHFCFFERTTGGHEHADALADQTGGQVFQVGSSVAGYVDVRVDLSLALNNLIEDCLGTCLGDINLSGTVDPIDLGTLLSSWSIPASQGGCGGSLPCASDLNGDGFVNPIDLGMLLSNWGPCGSSMQAPQGGEGESGGESPLYDLWTVLHTSIEDLLQWLADLAGGGTD